jgi:membrane peptidoglycan carboxypeptidase
VSDHRNHRHRASEPAWPTGEDPDPRAAKPQQTPQQEDRTGFWSPLWDDDEDAKSPGRPANGHGRRERSNGHAQSGSNGHARNGSEGQPRNGSHARKGGDHAWPEAEPPAAPRHAEPPAPPRPSPPRRAANGGANGNANGGAPVWPSGEEAPNANGRRAAGPHTPPPGRPGKQGPPPGQATRVVRPRPAGPPRPGMPAPGMPPGRPGVDPNGPTEVMPPAHRSTGPEPGLLTHREPDYDEELYDDPDLGYEDEDQPLSDSDRKHRRKKIWRRVRRGGYVLTALMIIGPLIGFFIAYQTVEVPTPESVAAQQQQVVTLKYNDGATDFSKIVPKDGLARTFVRYDEIPDVVKHAVFAAEDSEFMTNPGFDIKGVLNAGWNQATGGTGGGSTITQQYIKQATGNDEASGLGGYSRKALEVVKAYKMNNTYSKEDILEAYLNTIYFGRSANGIVAAAKAYYGKELKDLTPSEAALLAGMIQSPGKYKDDAYMHRRWTYVIGQMSEKGWLSPADRQAAQYPPLIPLDQARPVGVEGPNAHIQKAVLDEVESDTGLTLAQLRQRGYTVVTTIDKRAQDLAVEAVNSVMGPQPPNLLPALVAVRPDNGEVVAYYGGANGNGLDWAATRQEPGSSFKPFDLVGLLEKGKGLGEVYDGSSPRQFGGPGSPQIRNAGNDNTCKQCTVSTAMRKSINTVFYDIALNDVGTQGVANAAHQAGIKSDLQGANGGAPDGNIAIGGGTTRVSTLEMASAYATFAANGIHRTPHLVSKILTPDGGVYWEQPASVAQGQPAFDKEDLNHNQMIARNVTESLRPIPKSSKVECANGRDCAGKTGTHQLGETADNAKAWMVGYTPQISVAVSMAAEENGKQVPLKTNTGKIVYGATLPGPIWQKFMNSYLQGAPKLTFGPYKPIGKPASEKPQGEDEQKDGDNKHSGGNSETNGNSQTNDPPTDHHQDPSTNPSSPNTEPTGTSEPNGPGNNCPPVCLPGGNNNGNNNRSG